MADTTYIDYVQPAVNAEWLNEVNDHVWHDTPVNGVTLHSASVIKVVPSGGLSSENVQDTLEELDTKKVAFSQLNDDTGSSLIGFKQNNINADIRTVEHKLQEIISVKDFGAVGDGITDDTSAFQAADASATTLYIPKGVYLITSDITFISELHFAMGAILDVQSGTRIYLNGGIIANPNQQCFNSTLLTNTITASINGNALTVTTITSPTITVGQILTGTGVGKGQFISQAFSTTGVGTYTLNDYNGILSSRTMTLTGASVSFGAGTIREVYPQWFGAVGDGTTDDTSAFKQAVYSILWGGKVKVPVAKYKITDSIILHPSITIEGDCAGNPYAGQPSPSQFNTVPYIFMASDNKAIFIITGRCNKINIRQITFATDITPYMSGGDFSPYGINRIAILYSGHFPQYLFGGVIDSCYFFGFDHAISVEDTWAVIGDGVGTSGTYWNGTTSVVYHDWAINPIQISNCTFIACIYGISFNTNNADAWCISNCVFYIPINGQGVYLIRCGYLKLETCFATGATVTNTEFVTLVGTGVSALDSITLDNCQAENCSHFIRFNSGSTNTTPPAINVYNCKYELGSDVYLGSPCEYNSQNNVILAQTYIDSSNVRINTINDHFWYVDYVSNPTYGITIISGDSTSINTYIQGKYPCSSISGPIFNGAPYYTISSSGSPVGVITPLRIGEVYFDGVLFKFYMSTGLTNSDWVAIN